MNTMKVSTVRSLTYCFSRPFRLETSHARETKHIAQSRVLGHSHHMCLSSTAGSNLTGHSVAIVGSGPAGYYTAQQLLKGNSNLIVDIYEKCPVPFGLVRFGVAPDHPEVKNVIHTFSQTGQNIRCNFLGNVEVGKDVTLTRLREAYSAVVLSYGAADDRVLGIPGENLSNVLSARSFVGWYNGLPEDQNLPVDLDTESAVILGHGNVALDVARILLTPINILEKTDICEHALEALHKSRVQQVYVVGRRGPLQVRFTIKELREMITLPGTRTLIKHEDVEHFDKIIPDLPRPRRRLTELMHKTGTSRLHNNATSSHGIKEWHLLFKRSPLRLLPSDHGSVAGVEFSLNKLQGDSIVDQRAVATDERETIPCGLVLRSIGYKGLPINPQVPFDASRGVIDNTHSRVTGEIGLYCSGWASLGPVVVILGTMTDAFETGKVVLHDIDSGVLQNKGLNDRNKLLEELQDTAVTFKEWERIDLAEMSAGEKIGKPREKLISLADMLKVAKS